MGMAGATRRSAAAAEAAQDEKRADKSAESSSQRAPEPQDAGSAAQVEQVGAGDGADAMLSEKQRGKKRALEDEDDAEVGAAQPAAPPLPEEEPPLPDEQPPLPEDEQPPLPEDEPADEQPPLPEDEEQPPLPDGDEHQPPLPEDEEEPASAADGTSAAAPPGTIKKGDWTAIWSQEAQMYYFWNSKTNTTTWENPLAKGGDEAEARESSAAREHEEEQEEGLPEITPDLAYLDPTLARQRSGAAGVPAFTAQFNRRTGRFTGSDAAHLTPDRISDFSRGERQQQAFYDVDSWRAQLEGRARKEAGEGCKPEKVTKKDLERFKAQKEARKKRRLDAWL